jgi:hypothetical protein
MSKNRSTVHEKINIGKLLVINQRISIKDIQIVFEDNTISTDSIALLVEPPLLMKLLVGSKPRGTFFFFYSILTVKHINISLTMYTYEYITVLKQRQNDAPEYKSKQITRISRA